MAVDGEMYWSLSQYNLFNILLQMEHHHLTFFFFKKKGMKKKKKPCENNWRNRREFFSLRSSILDSLLLVVHCLFSTHAGQLFHSQEDLELLL